MRTSTQLLSSLLLIGSGFLVACGGQSTPAPVAPEPAAPAVSTADPSPSETAPAPATSAAPADAASAAEKEKEHHPHWKYAGTEGPEKWGELSPEWEKCKTGKEQSPVDLPKKGEKPTKAVALATSYGKIPLQIVNNGHTVQVTGTGGGKVTLDGTDYELAQFHFHSPSEHTVAGAKFDGELHLVHKNAKGELAVIGILIKKGKENKVLAPVFAAAPKEEGKDPQPVANVTVDIAQLVPAKAPYYSYPGSLTTPPCSEGVKWFVLENPITASEAQIKQFRDATHGEDSARPTLPLNARKVTDTKP